MFDYMGALVFRSGFAVGTMSSSKGVQKHHIATPVLLSRLQGNKPHWNSPEPSETLELSKTLRTPLEPSRSCLRNLHQHTSEPSGTFRNLPPEPTPPELSGTCLRNLHQHTPELSGTFWNLPPEPAPQTRTGTHRSLSGLKTPLAYAVGEI